MHRHRLTGLSLLFRRAALGLAACGLPASIALARTPTPTDGPPPTALRTQPPQPTPTPPFPVLRVTASPNPARSGQRVTLDGSASFDAAGARWSQIDEEAIRLHIDNANSLVASFVTPPVSEATTVQVMLQLTEFILYTQLITIIPADAVQVVVGYATGPPGGSASLDVTFHPAGLAVTELHHQLGFEAAAAVADRGDGVPDCVGGSDISAGTFVFLPDGCTPGLNCDRIDAVVTARDPIPDNAVLYRCVIAISDAPADTCNHPLACAGGDATTQDHMPLGLSCIDGSVTAQYDIPGLDVTFQAEPAEPLVGDIVHLTFFAYGRGGDVTAGLVGAAPYLSGPMGSDMHGFGEFSFDMRAECPGTANLQLRVNYETDLGCPGTSTTFYQFVSGESPVYPLRVREPGTFRVSGRVGEFPNGCEGAIPGVTVTLEPLGREVLSGSDFAFDDVPPGDYTLTVTPACTTFACWSPQPITVADADVSVVLCPQPPSARCPGDCNANSRTEVDELIRGVAISLGEVPLAACPRLDANGDGDVRVDELVDAVAASLDGCPIL